LFEGKVRIKGDGYIDSLKAGEQLIAKAGRKVQKLVVDSAESRVQGWKENKFKWVHTDLRSLMEDLSHWYGYSIKYKVDVPLETYTITIDRFEPLQKVLRLLHKPTELNFKLEGTTIVVYPDVTRGK
jgi:transmembrane sensor